MKQELTFSTVRGAEVLHPTVTRGQQWLKYSSADVRNDSAFNEWFVCLSHVNKMLLVIQQFPGLEKGAGIVRVSICKSEVTERKRLELTVHLLGSVYGGYIVCYNLQKQALTWNTTQEAQTKAGVLEIPI